VARPFHYRKLPALRQGLRAQFFYHKIARMNASFSEPSTPAPAPLAESEVEQLLKQSGALLEGHFLLTSGRHSQFYVEKFRLLEQPRVTSALCGEIARRFRDDDIECVIGPVTGGIILAFEVARQLSCRAVYAERGEGGKGFEFRRGFQINPGERVLVVEDIVTTGGSVLQVVHAAEAEGARVLGVGLLVDRSGGKADFGSERVEPLLRLNFPTYAPGEVPAWIEEKFGAARKPGSSKK
jgi:orotate phosphoribosyltransferase